MDKGKTVRMVLLVDDDKYAVVRVCAYVCLLATKQVTNQQTHKHT
jgi:hypothetical protein